MLWNNYLHAARKTIKKDHCIKSKSIPTKEKINVTIVLPQKKIYHNDEIKVLGGPKGNIFT